MKKPLLKVILLRTALVIAALAVIYFGYLLVGIYLSPVPVPPAVRAKKSVTFDPALDVSKQPTFTQLQSLGAVNVSTTNLGRDNPFLPVPTTTPPAAPPSETASSVSSSDSMEAAPPQPQDVFPTTATTTHRVTTSTSP